MSEATIFTIAVLSLMAISASLACFIGFVLGKRRVDSEISQAYADGYNSGHDLDEKTRKIGERAKRFSR